MLAPRDRTLLLESLRPPAGYRLGRALTTTYTLDLVALLTAPLAFTFFDWEDDEGLPSGNPLALLEAVRRNARRLHVFCHGGAIHVPKRGQVLLAHLEPCVVEVAAPKGGVFHPKVWVLRFDPEPGSRESVRYRLLVGTRNLTFDRSWDTLLRLDGEPTAERGLPRRNRPLAEFVGALPGLATGEVPGEAQTAAAELAEELRAVEWERPAKVRELEFLPLGLGREAWPFDRGRRRLVIAPFLDTAFLERFAGEREDGVAISRSDALHAALDGLDGFSERYVLADGADGDEEDEAEASSGHAEPASEASEGSLLRGLHAKLFVLDDGHRAHVFTGSANGTLAAFERNVEFLVRLDASKHAMGIDTLLGREVKGALLELLEPWKAVEIEEDPERELRERLERRAEEVRDALARSDLRLEATLAGTGNEGDGAASEEEVLRLELQGERPSLQKGVRITVWPVVLGPQAAAELDSSSPLARFEVSLGAATAFLAFEVLARESGLEHRLRFARRLPLTGLPEDRDERLLRLLLKDRETVLRLLYLLLSAEEISAERLIAIGQRDGTGEWRTNDYGLPLLEPLVKALARGPEGLAPVERLIADLSRTEEGRAMLPEGFEELWDAVRSAREELAS